MTDPRLTPANERVAAFSMAGKVEAERYVAGDLRRVLVPVADLNRKPIGPRDRQLLYGAEVTVFEDHEGWSFVQSVRDAYVGYVATTALGPARTATHYVATPATHLYQTESFKSRDLMHLSFGARVTVVHELKRFWETPDGYIPKVHLRPLSMPFTDPVTVAQMHFGVPYLWGGNSTLGIDCSGLVQAALLACDIPCPGDSDLQRGALGQDVPAGAGFQRGDLLFWKGHVGMLVDADTLIHANAHHMAVAYEPAAHAIIRIAAQGDGPVIAHKRL